MHKIDTIYKVKISFMSDFIGGATSEHQHDRKGYGDDDDGGEQPAVIFFPNNQDSECMDGQVGKIIWNYAPKFRLIMAAVWPDLAKFRLFGTMLKHFGRFEIVHFVVFAKIVTLFWQICYAIVRIFIGVLIDNLLNK